MSLVLQYRTVGSIESFATMIRETCIIVYSSPLTEV